MEEEREAVEGVKLHRKGRVMTAQSIQSEDDIFSFQGGGRSTGIVKFLEPLSPLLNYFECVIVNKGRETAIGVGCGERSYPMTRMPGWNRNSCGYHADDGKLYHESGMGRAFGPRCITGDRMGCGVTFDTGLDRGMVEVFFTKNGNQVGEVERMKRPLNGIYPLIGLHSVGEKVRYLGHWRRTADGATEPMEEDESPETRWLRCNGVKFLDNGLLLEYAGMGGGVQDVGMAQSRYPVNRTNHYFEIEIVEEGSQGAVAIGLGKTTYPLHRHPGWNTGGVGYHADDGKLFKGQGQGDPFGPKCTAGDRMGCGVEFELEVEEEVGSDSEESDTEQDVELERPVQQRRLMMGDDTESEGSDVSEESYSDDSILEDMLLPIPDPFMVPPGLGRGGGPFRFGGGRRLFGREQGMMEAAVLGRMAQRQREGGRGREPRPDRRTCVVYFTKNGEKVGEVECELPRGGFYPVVAMLSVGEKIRVNFNPLTG